MTPELSRLETQIRTLISQERYVEAQVLLPEYSKAVVESCNGKADRAAFENAKAFLKAAIQRIKAQRTHDADRLAALQTTRAYTGEPEQNNWSLLG